MLLPPISVKNDHNEIFMEYVNLNYYSNTERNYGFVFCRLKKASRENIKVKREKNRDSASIFCDLEKRVANIDHLDGGEIVSSFKLEFDCEQIDILIENLGCLSD